MRRLGTKLLVIIAISSLSACSTYERPGYRSAALPDVDCRNAPMYMRYWQELLDKQNVDSSVSKAYYDKTLMIQIERTKAKCGV